MRVLAIDASTKSTGIALFEDEQLLEYKCITASSPDLIKRIQKILTELKTFVVTHQMIDTIVLEEVRPDSGYHANPKVFKALMYLQAAIAFWLHEQYPKVNLEFVYPSEWRSKCGIKTGRGLRRDNQKESDIQFVKETYHIDVNDDIADAIGIGHAYVNQLSNEMNWE